MIKKRQSLSPLWLEAAKPPHSSQTRAVSKEEWQGNIHTWQCMSLITSFRSPPVRSRICPGNQAALPAPGSKGGSEDGWVVESWQAGQGRAGWQLLCCSRPRSSQTEVSSSHKVFTHVRPVHFAGPSSTQLLRVQMVGLWGYFPMRTFEVCSIQWSSDKEGQNGT